MDQLLPAPIGQRWRQSFQTDQHNSMRQYNGRHFQVVRFHPQTAGYVIAVGDRQSVLAYPHEVLEPEVTIQDLINGS